MSLVSYVNYLMCFDGKSTKLISFLCNSRKVLEVRTPFTVVWRFTCLKMLAAFSQVPQAACWFGRSETFVSLFTRFLPPLLSEAQLPILRRSLKISRENIDIRHKEKEGK